MTAKHAADKKSLKISSVSTSYISQPLALETVSPINTTGISCLSELGCRLTHVSW